MMAIKRKPKKCRECGKEKDIRLFYYPQTKCKECVKMSLTSKLSNPIAAEDETRRHREKYHRLGYKDLHKPDFETKKRDIANYKARYPEKTKAKNATTNMTSTLGELHHWSYNDAHLKDVIDISTKSHYKAHRFLNYDKEAKMYRRIDNMELLDTKEKHLSWIDWCIRNKEN
jgi:hypothetical protein